MLTEKELRTLPTRTLGEIAGGLLSRGPGRGRGLGLDPQDHHRHHEREDGLTSGVCYFESFDSERTRKRREKKMATEAKKEVEWMGLDTASLTGDVLKAREAQQAANTKAREAKEKFQEAVIKAARSKKLIKEDETYVFAFLPGRVRIAVVPLSEMKDRKDGRLRQDRQAVAAKPRGLGPDGLTRWASVTDEPARRRDRMNKERRKEIQDAIDILNEIKGKFDEAKSLIDGAADGEREYYDNMPEGFQQGDKGQNAESAASSLEEAKDALENLDVDDVISKLDEAVSF